MVYLSWLGAIFVVALNESYTRLGQCFATSFNDTEFVTAFSIVADFLPGTCRRRYSKQVQVRE